PTLSSGPIDRYRRFGQDWAKIRGRTEFLDDLDAAVARVFQGFLYKFIIAALISIYWMDRVDGDRSFGGVLQYMYAYTAYLFFDFAGYSAFAIGFSRLFGIRTPENFDKPFLSKNIKDFWNRWHMSLSFWFRDHVYMRFLLAAGKGKWFKGKHTASYLGLTLTFGLMGIWHGLELHYILYGFYHAALLCGYEVFSRWNKKRKLWGDGPFWRGANILLTCHVVAFGLLLFSGHITPKPPPRFEEVAEVVDCESVSGWAWDSATPNKPLVVDIYVDGTLAETFVADQFREELKDRGFGDARHGFEWKIPDWIKDGNPHSIGLRVTESGRVLRGTPAVINCEPANR
ncbi:MAG: MBOAT family O-acyltransferase, partial [Chthoniobacteraceae bacterium]